MMMGQKLSLQYKDYLYDHPVRKAIHIILNCFFYVL
jgi:hypothetical protein